MISTSQATITIEGPFRYANKDNTHSTGAIFLGTNRKVKLPLDVATLKSKANDLTVTNATLTLIQSSQRYNTTGIVYVGCRPPGTEEESANYVFPNKTWSGNTLQAFDANPDINFGTAGATIILNCTNSVKYALEHYTSGTMALWLFSTHSSTAIGFGNSTTLTLTLDDHSNVQGAAKPTIPATNGVTFTNNHFSYSTLGVHVAGYNRFTATGHATIDTAHFPNLSAKYTLTLTDASSNIVWTTTQTDNQTFSVPVVNTTGVINWTYTVNDTAGNQVAATGRAFTVVGYIPPTITGLTAERYAIRAGDTAGSTIYTPDPSAENVRFNFHAIVTDLNKKNTWRIYVQATNMSGGAGGQAKKQVYTSTGTTGIQKTNDQTIYPGEGTSIVTFSAQYDWRFEFTISDLLSERVFSCSVGKSVSILNIESNGVAIGKFITATSAKRFECAYPSRFDAGITGGFSYAGTHYEYDDSYNSDSQTGGTWVDGKKIYRLRYKGKRSFTKGQDNIVAIGLGGEVDSLISIQGFVKDADGIVYPIPCAAPSLNWALTFTIEGKNVYLRYLSTNSGTWGGKTDLSFGIIVEYTRA